MVLSGSRRNYYAEFAFLRDGETDETAYLTYSGQMVLTCPECYAATRSYRRRD